MTHIAVVVSPYKAGFYGHLRTHFHVELSAKVPGGQV